jgi:hypothetical protein
MRDGDGPAARWVACLRSTLTAEAIGAAGCTALDHLHNQLGLSAEDQHRIYVVLARSLRSADSGRRRQAGRQLQRATLMRCTAR